MKRKWVAFGIILLFIGTAFLPVTAQGTNQQFSTMIGNLLYVGGTGLGNYTRIQDAIENSSDGDTIYVFSESSPYIENLKIYKEIHLIGENKNSTEIKGLNPDDEIIEITTADFVTISGFTFTSDNETNVPLIRIYSSYNTIAGNIFEDNNTTFETAEVGISLTSTSLSCTINDNLFQNTSKGVDIEGSHYNNLYKNSFHSNSFGVIIFYGLDNMIANNTFMNGSCGMLISNSNATTIADNVFLSYYNEGVEIGSHCSNNRIFRNSFSLCGEGISVSFLSNNNKIQGNSLKQNSHGIMIGSSSEFNIIENNEFIENRYYGIQIHGSYNEVKSNIVKDNDDAGIIISGQHNDISYNLIENNDKGVYLQSSNYNMITYNNFIKNKGFFMYPFKNHWSINNIWDKNYWDTLNGNIKIISGRLKIVLYTWTNWMEKQTYEIAVYPLRFNVDWHPAQNPYDLIV